MCGLVGVGRGARKSLGVGGVVVGSVLRGRLRKERVECGDYYGRGGERGGVSKCGRRGSNAELASNDEEGKDVGVCYGGICTVGVVVRAGKGGQAAQVYEPSGPLAACMHTGQQSTRRSKKAVSGGMAGALHIGASADRGPWPGDAAVQPRRLALEPAWPAFEQVPWPLTPISLHLEAFVRLACPLCVRQNDGLVCGVHGPSLLRAR